MPWLESLMNDLKLEKLTFSSLFSLEDSAYCDATWVDYYG